MSSAPFINTSSNNTSKSLPSSSEETEENSSFFDDFSDGVYEALESKTCKLLILAQLVLMIAIVCVTLNITQYRVIDLLSQAYEHVKHDIDGDQNDGDTLSSSSFAARLRAKENALPRVLGRKLGAFIYKQLSTEEDNAAILSGSLPILFAKVATSPLGKASASATRLMTYTLQIMKEYYPNTPTMQDEANTWMNQNCNFSSQYPYPQVYVYPDTAYPQYGYAMVYCQTTINYCCGSITNTYCVTYYEENCNAQQYIYYYSPSNPVTDIYQSMSKIRSYVAPVMYTPQLPAPDSISSRTEAFSILSLTKLVNLVDWQGDLSSYVTLGGLACHEFIDDARKLNWNFNFEAGDGTPTSWDIRGTVNDVLHNMQIVCNKMTEVNNTAPLPPVGPNPPKKSQTPKNSQKLSEKPTPSEILTITIASLMIFLSLVLLIILVKSLFGWLAHCPSLFALLQHSNEADDQKQQTTHQEEDQTTENDVDERQDDPQQNRVTTEDDGKEDDDEEEEEDLVFELFYRRRNQVLLLINLILILAVCIAAITAVSYKQYLLDAENFVHHQVKDRTPAAIGIELGKALSKLKGISDDGITSDTAFLGFPVSTPKLLKKAMLVDYELMTFKASEFTSRVGGLISSYCSRDNRETNSTSACQPWPQRNPYPNYPWFSWSTSSGVAAHVVAWCGSVTGSLSPNFVFGSYKGNLAPSYIKPNKNSSAVPLAPSDTTMFSPIHTLNWASQQLTADGQYQKLNLEGCHTFATNLRSLHLTGVYTEYSNNVSTPIFWNYQTRKDQIASSISMICNELSNDNGNGTVVVPPVAPPPPTTTSSPSIAPAPPNSNGNKNHDEHHTHVAAITGGVGGGLVLILIIFLVASFKKPAKKSGSFDKPVVSYSSSVSEQPLRTQTDLNDVEEY